MRFTGIVQLLLLVKVSSAVEAVCRWKDDSIAADYLPCIKGATRGTCCRQGETCLESGLCYGGVGLVYRGACVNVWDENSCLTYCEEISKDWANLFPCPVEGKGSAAGPLTWWCGNSGSKACTTQGVTLKIVPGLGARVLGRIDDPEPSTSSSTPTPALTTSQSSTESILPSTLSTTSTIPVLPTLASQTPSITPPASTGPNIQTMVIGLGVGLAILAIAILVAIIFWIRYLRRQQAVKLRRDRNSETEAISSEYKRELDGRTLSTIHPPTESTISRRTTDGSDARSLTSVWTPVELSTKRKTAELHHSIKVAELDSGTFI